MEGGLHNSDVSHLGSIRFSLFFTTPLFELHATHVHYSGGDLVNVVLLLLGEAQHIEGFLNFIWGKKLICASWILVLDRRLLKEPRTKA